MNADFERFPDREVANIARQIVNQILDQSGADVRTRQGINDACDQYAYRMIAQLSHAREARLRLIVTSATEAIVADLPDPLKQTWGYAEFAVSTAVVQIERALRDAGTTA